MTQAPWWERLPARVLEEEAALLLLRDGDKPIVRSHQWVRHPDGDPRIKVTLSLGSASHDVEVRFPPHYPEGCPSVRPIPYDGRPISSHQFKSGVFCLELGPDNWHPRYMVADVITSTWRLIAREFIGLFEPIDIPSRHAPDLADRIRCGEDVLLRSDSLEERLLEAETQTAFEYVWPNRNPFRIFVVAFPTGTPTPEALPALSRESRMAGLFVRLSEGAPPDVPLESTEFNDYVGTHGQAKLGEASTVILLQWTDRRTRGFMRLKTRVLELVDVPFDLAVGARTPDGLRAAVSALNVGIVGAGSLGSKIAVSLARSGVRRFVLVDGDLLLSANICRHAADHADVGALKVEVVKELIRNVSSTQPEIATHAVNLGAPTNPEYHARILDELGAADLVIDATANPDVFGLLAALASDNRRPLVWGEVFGGGLGGLVASAHPDHGPCPRCVRAGFLAAASSWPPAPGGHVDIPYGGGDGEPLSATDADISSIAGAVTKRVFDLAARQEPEPPAVSLVGLRRGWIFDDPSQTISVKIRADDWSCDRCWKPEAVPDPRASELAAALLSDAINAEDSPST